MTRPPAMNLPSEAMKWGRWFEDSDDDVKRAIAAQEGDNNSAGSQFKSRADGLTTQINGVNSVSTQFTIDIPTFTRTSPAGSGTNRYYFVSPQQTFTPPKPIGKYRALIIANVVCSDSAGDLQFSYAYVKVNGMVTSSQRVNNNSVYGTTARDMNMSVSGAADVVDGSPIVVEFAADAADLTAHNVTFTGSSITVVYVGGL